MESLAIIDNAFYLLTIDAKLFILDINGHLATPLTSGGFRSSKRRCFAKKGVLRNFAKFTGKHLCQSLFFNKVAGLRQNSQENLQNSYSVGL